MSESIPAALQRKINSARELPDRPHQKRIASPVTVSEMLAVRAKESGGSPFLTYVPENGDARSYTYSEFYRQACRTAAMLFVYAGIKRGERVATAMHNHDQAMICTFAAWHLGASVVPLNMGEDDKRLAYVLEHSHARVLFVLGEYVERIRPLLKNTQIEHVVVVEGEAGASSEARLQDVVPNADVPQFETPEDARPDDEALIVYTSGTTGVPKGVVLSQYNLISDAYSITQWQGWKPQTRLMCVLPIHHVNGMVVTHITPVFCGASVVQLRKFSARNFFEIADKYGVEVCSVVPTLLQFLLESYASLSADAARKLAPSLQYVICGAGPLTVDLAARFEDRFGIPICHGYGLSETTCYSCYLPIVQRHRSDDADHRAWMRDYGYPSIGIPVAANEMAIHDDNGAAQAPGVKGEIVIRGHNVMIGYADNLKANEDAFTHSWFRSGDEGFWMKGADGQPYFFISGRFKELIIRGGVKISPLEVDEVINCIPGVKAGMAVGFENVTYGEEVGAYVVKLPDSKITAEEIIAGCRAKLPFATSPKVVVFGESFPVTSTGKYQRTQLKPLFEKYRETQFRGC